MEKNLRYKMEHLGDYFVDMLSTVADTSKASARGVVLTYDIHKLAKEKEIILNNIGKRLTQIRKDDPALNISQDERMRELLDSLDEIEKKLKGCFEERENLLYPKKTVCCSSTTDSADNAKSVEAAESTETDQTMQTA